MRVQQFQNDSLVAVRNQIAYLERRIFIAHELSKPDQPRQIDSVPSGRCSSLRLNLRDFFFRVVNQRAELRKLIFAKQIPEDVIDLLPNDAGAVVNYVQEQIVLAVKVAHKMFGALRHVKPRLQINQFLVDGFFRRILFR